MSNKSLHYLKEVLFVSVLWIMMTLLYVFIKFNDVPDHFLREIYGMPPNVSTSWILLVSLFVAAPLGLLFGILYSYIYPYVYRTRSFWMNIFVRLVIFIGIMVMVFAALIEFTDFKVLLIKNSLGIFVYMLVTEMLMGLVVLIRRNIGSDYLLNTILNTYRNPKEEERVFMFLDMQESTPSAEKMGHLKFSSYIQDCFYDLSDIVLEHGGSIYQFVGDEAVITWKVTKRNDYEKCIDLYFAYTDYLEDRGQYYMNNYNMKPVFKCGIHSGKVSTALVGDYKKEIAYHGDVLNLCSRLQAICKRTDCFVIVSKSFFDKIRISCKYYYESVSLDNLKGFSKEQHAYFVFKNLSNVKSI